MSGHYPRAIVSEETADLGRRFGRRDYSRREMAPQRLEKIESAPGNGMVSEASNPQDLVRGRAADRGRAARTTKSRAVTSKLAPVGQLGAGGGRHRQFPSRI